jgi:hypothetical protein
MLVGEAKNGQCSTTGGTAPITFSVASGTLPAGITLDASSGILTGSPTQANLTESFPQIQATDSGSPVQKALQRIDIRVDLPGQFMFGCPLTSAAYETPYFAYCEALGGYPPYTYAIVSGSLPSGLTFDTNSGSISGTPTATGTSKFTVRATDSGSPPNIMDSPQTMVVGPHGYESDSVVVTGTSGAIVNTTTIKVTVNP